MPRSYPLLNIHNNAIDPYAISTHCRLLDISDFASVMEGGVRDFGPVGINTFCSEQIQSNNILRIYAFEK